mmetsp:Transcript_28049/g.65516  ORF Transcript_28049/g.65516 Transcript_28049/m.65516 type:complete len:215 (-) Transcript_28049:111-755(-)
MHEVGSSTQPAAPVPFKAAPKALKRLLELQEQKLRAKACALPSLRSPPARDRSPSSPRRSVERSPVRRRRVVPRRRPKVPRDQTPGMVEVSLSSDEDLDEDLDESSQECDASRGNHDEREESRSAASDEQSTGGCQGGAANGAEVSDAAGAAASPSQRSGHVGECVVIVDDADDPGERQQQPAGLDSHRRVEEEADAATDDPYLDDEPLDAPAG